MEYRDFEKHIQDTFRGGTEEVNHDALIASLGIEDKNDGGFLLWGAVILGLISSLILGAYFFDFNVGQYSLSDVSTTQEHSETIAISKVEAASINAEVNPEDAQSTASVAIDIEHPHSDQYLTEVKKETTTTGPNEGVTKTLEANATAYNSEENNSIIITKDKSTEFVNAERKSEILNQFQIEENTSSSKIVESRTSELIMLPELEKLDHDLILKDSDLSDINKQKIVCPSFKDKQYWMEFGLEAGIGPLSQSLESSHADPSFIDQYRIDHEEGIEDLNVKAFVALQSKKLPIGGKIGLSLSRFSNRLAYEDEYTQRDTTVGIISTTVSPQGDTITHIYGDIVTETTYKLQQKRHYYLYKLDIPISALYTLYFNRNAVQFELGAILNIRTWSEGHVLAEDPTGTLPRTFTPIEDEGIIKRNVGVSMFGQVNFLRMLNNGYSVYAAPYFTMSPSTFSTSSEISQKYWSGGLKVGVMKAF